MNQRLSTLLVLLLALPATAMADDPVIDRDRDILVTFDNSGARVTGRGIDAPYRNRRRYLIAATTRRNADDIANQYSLAEIDHWPIRSLSLYCFVYRVPSGLNRNDVIDRLRADARVESVQPMNEFETGTDANVDYNDTFAKLQHGLDILDISAAHRYSLGDGVRIAIIDSQADARHEDLRGRFRSIKVFADPGHTPDLDHGTAVASVIGARTNNATGIVGIAPKASLELFVSCWSEAGSDSAVCDSFTLAKALDSVLEDPPDIVNLSINGPDDALLTRLIEKAVDAGVIVVAADAANSDASNRFPADLDQVIGVGISEPRLRASNITMPHSGPLQDIYAPGNEIMVALPNNHYDFRSGSSLAAAHVSGVIALLLAKSPGLPFNAVLKMLRASQAAAMTEYVSVNACVSLRLADSTMNCL